MTTTKLQAYNQKRHFEKTGEPHGEAAKSAGALRFVVHHHSARSDHYDFRLEWSGVLMSWAVPKGPSYNTRERRLAVHVEDHPLDYRHFEGTIPKGEYGGGVVQIWDEGFWKPAFGVEEGLRDGALKFFLDGKRLKGSWALIRLKRNPGESKDNWLLLKEKDGFANQSVNIGSFATSVRTGRTMKEIENEKEDEPMKNPFDRVDVQLAKLVKKTPERGDWLYEMKYDGYRIVAFVDDGGVRLMTRNAQDYTDRFQSVASSLSDWADGRAMVLDGEMVATDDDGKTDFQALQNYLRHPSSQHLTYIVFDLLALDSKDLRGRPLAERKETLEALLKDLPAHLQYSRHVSVSGDECLAAACRSGMEGIVGKKAGASYRGTRNGDWIKLKCDKRQEFVIGGFTLADKRSGGVSALLLGVYDSGDFVYAGRAGTGLSQADMQELTEKFKDIKRGVSPFNNTPKTRSNETVTWLEPVLVAEIKFAEWTEDRLLRQASYKGLRTDKKPGDVVMKTPDDA